MTIDEPTREQMAALVSDAVSARWQEVIEGIDRLYDMERTWGKGFGEWVYETKFRRGGKTLCALYMKLNVAEILFTLGKAERERFEAQRDAFSAKTNAIYDATDALHDGKWLWLPVETPWSDIEALLKIKRRPNRKAE